MGHHHDHHHATANIKVAFLLNLAFTIIEVIGGLMTNSLAILSDALHDLGDCLSLGLSWYFQKLSGRGRTDTFSYGYKRFSLLGAVINALVLVAGSVVILVYAVPRLFQPEQTDARGMLLLAVLGVIINGAAALRLRKGASINERVVSLHLLEDVLGWVAVLLGSILMIFFDLPFIDPLLSILISLFMLFNVYKSLRKSLLIILQGTPEALDIEALRAKLREIKEVVGIHDCHAWSMDGQYNVLTIHLVLDADYRLSEQVALKKRIEEKLSNDSIHHMTIAFEIEEEPCGLKDC